MVDQKSRKNQAKTLRLFRKVHRVTGVALFLFYFVIAVTGLLLGWKKHTGGIILAKTEKGVSDDMKEWITLDSLKANALFYLQNHDPWLDDEIDRVDVRPDKGIVKFTFKKHFTGLQLDATTGQLLKVEKRWSDFIENIHDASILDKVFKTRNEPFKLIYTSVMSLALIVFTVTGFWLWYGPKVLKKTAR